MILIISPQTELVKALVEELAQADHSTVTAPDLEVALSSGHLPELVALDLSPAHPQGWDELRQLRGAPSTSNLPVVALLPTEDLAHPAEALAAEDFLLLPLRPGEAALRIGRLLARATPSPGALRFGDLTIDVARYEVTLGGELVDLAYKEYQLLRFLAENAGQVFTREMLLDRVWGYDYFGGSRTVDVHVRRLRSKIETGGRSFIETVRNVGYRFKARG